MSVITAVLINDTRADRHHGCTSVMDAIEQLSAASSIEMLATNPVHLDWRTNTAFRSAFDRADLVIVNGEGTVHSGKPEGRALLAAGDAARAAGKRSAIINFSWHGNDVDMERQLASFDLVAVRESRSFASVAEIRSDCRLVPDLSLYGPRPKRRERSGVGFGDSVMAHVTDALIRKSGELNARAMPIRFAGAGVGGKARFARSFVSRDALRHPHEGAAAARRLAWHSGATTPDLDEYLNRLSHLDLLVTGRFHGVTLALRALTPVLAVASNTPKIEGTMADAGLEPWRLVDPSRLDRALIEKASAWTADERRNVEQYLSLANSEAERLFCDLRACVG